MSKVIIMGSGAAPGVPSVSKGWGNCDPNNPKNLRRRVGTYVEMGQAKVLIDTSPDLRMQLIDNHISYIDVILYTHAHADHVNGIDDVRELNRVTHKPIDFYAIAESMKEIKDRFSYLIDSGDSGGYRANLTPHVADFEHDFYVKDTKIGVLPLKGHNLPSAGYVFNDGELVYIADCCAISENALEKIKVRPKLMIMPLTTVENHYVKKVHMDLDKVLKYVNLIKPERTILNHMAIECDYNCVNALTPENVEPAYDNMVIDF